MLFPRNVFGQLLFFGWWVVVAIDLRTDFNGRHITRVECWTQSKLAVFFSKARHTKPFAKVRHKGGGTLPPESAFLWNKNGIYTQGHVENKIQFKFQVCVCVSKGRWNAHSSTCRVWLSWNVIRLHFYIFKYKNLIFHHHPRHQIPNKRKEKNP